MTLLAPAGRAWLAPAAPPLFLIRPRVKLGVRRQTNLFRKPGPRRLIPMSSPIFDFSHLSAAERIELAERLWDSLEPLPDAVDPALAADLRQRRATLAADGQLGAPGDSVLDEIAARER